MDSKTLRTLADAKLTEARSTNDAEAAKNLIAEARSLIDQAKARDEADAMAAELAEVRNARPLAEIEAREVSQEEEEIRTFAKVMSGEVRAQTVAGSSGADGGYTVPTTVAAGIIAAAAKHSPLLDQNIVTMYVTDSGAPIKVNSRGANRKAALVAENGSVGEITAKLNTVTLGAHKLAEIATASRELLQDSATDVRAWLAADMGEAFGAGANEQLTVGAGGENAPLGLATALAANAKSAAIATTASNAAALAAFVEELRQMQYSVNQVYRNNGSYMVNSEIEKVVGGLKDSAGNYIWVSARDGKPATLFGRPVICNDDLPITGAGKVYAVFGDFKSGYVTRFVRGFDMTELKEAFAGKDSIGWLAVGRVDGKIVNPSALTALKIPTA